MRDAGVRLVWPRKRLLLVAPAATPAAAAALSYPQVAFAPYKYSAQVSIDESDAFRGCHYSTVGVSITDALTGGDVTEQKPHCDWEGFDDGKYKNAWNGCDWGSCDEWE